MATPIGSVACESAAPPDAARLDALSSEELVALCDEVRDAVTGTDRPIQCPDGDVHWLLPSNQSCRDADLSACDATAGDVRRWHELARSDPCTAYRDSLQVGFTDPVSAPEEATAPQAGCEPLATRLDATGPTCPGSDASRLRAVEGVYEVISAAVPPLAPCSAALPEVVEWGAARLVLVSTQTSGVAEVILKSCGSLVDCQEIARVIRAAGEPPGEAPETPAYNRFDDCGALSPIEGMALRSRPPEGVPSCQVPWLPWSELIQIDAQLWLTVYPGRTVQPSPGCGYVTAPSTLENDGCSGSARYEARFESPL